MRIFLDTNVLIAACVRQHPHFMRADAIMRRCAEQVDEGLIHAHSILEFHSAITQLPGGLAVPPAFVSTLLDEGILPLVRCVVLTLDELRTVQRSAGERGIAGGAVYDLYHLAVAERESVDRLYTFNTGHFRALAPPTLIERIVAP